MALGPAQLSSADLDRLLTQAESRLSDSAPLGVAAKAKTSEPHNKTDGVEVASADSAAPGKQETAMEKKDALQVRTPKLAQKHHETSKEDAGADWYHLPKTDLSDPNTKRSFQLLRMRSVLAHGKQHFKKDTRKDAFPKYSQMGTIVEGPTEFYSGRLTRKERKGNILEEVLATGDQGRHGKFRSKYNEIQERKTSGRKAHYKKMKAMRRGKR